MLSTTDAIVLSLQPHSDKAHLLHAYTRTGGRINYMVYGLGRKNPRGIYTPLSLIQITADHDSLKPPTIKEATLLSSNRLRGLTSNSASGLTSNIYKQTVSLFIAEVLFHVLRHPMTDEPMFDFLAQSIEELDTTDTPQNFHLRFLVGLAAKLGFALPEDHPLTLSSSHPLTLSSSHPLILSSSHPLPHSLTNPLTRKERQQALRALCDYFAEHVETWQAPKSLDILMEVFD